MRKAGRWLRAKFPEYTTEMLRTMCSFAFARGARHETDMYYHVKSQLNIVRFVKGGPKPPAVPDIVNSFFEDDMDDDDQVEAGMRQLRRRARRGGRNHTADDDSSDSADDDIKDGRRDDGVPPPPDRKRARVDDDDAPPAPPPQQPEYKCATCGEKAERKPKKNALVCASEHLSCLACGSVVDATNAVEHFCAHPRENPMDKCARCGKCQYFCLGPDPAPAAAVAATAAAAEVDADPEEPTELRDLQCTYFAPCANPRCKKTAKKMTEYNDMICPQHTTCYVCGEYVLKSQAKTHFCMHTPANAAERCAECGCCPMLNSRLKPEHTAEARQKLIDEAMRYFNMAYRSAAQSAALASTLHE